MTDDIVQCRCGFVCVDRWAVPFGLCEVEGPNVGERQCEGSEVGLDREDSRREHVCHGVVEESMKQVG